MERGVTRIHLGEIRNDERGWVVDLLKTMLPHQPSLAGGHLASLQPGAVRGNHYHGDATECLMIFGGRARFLWKPPEGGAVQEEIIEGPGPVLFAIPPGCPHAIENISAGEIYLIALYDRQDPGVVRFAGLFPERLE